MNLSVVVLLTLTQFSQVSASTLEGYNGVPWQSDKAGVRKALKSGSGSCFHELYSTNKADSYLLSMNVFPGKDLQECFASGPKKICNFQNNYSFQTNSFGCAVFYKGKYFAQINNLEFEEAEIEAELRKKFGEPKSKNEISNDKVIYWEPAPDTLVYFTISLGKAGRRTKSVFYISRKGIVQARNDLRAFRGKLPKPPAKKGIAESI